MKKSTNRRSGAGNKDLGRRKGTRPRAGRTATAQARKSQRKSTPAKALRKKKRDRTGPSVYIDDIEQIDDGSGMHVVNVTVYANGGGITPDSVEGLLHNGTAPIDDDTDFATPIAGNAGQYRYSGSINNDGAYSRIRVRATFTIDMEVQRFYHDAPVPPPSYTPKRSAVASKNRRRR